MHAGSLFAVLSMVSCQSEGLPPERLSGTTVARILVVVLVVVRPPCFVFY